MDDLCQKKLRKLRDERVQEKIKPEDAPVVYAMPARLGSNAKGRGHAGTHLDLDHERDQAASGLAWLLKGRTPERLNPVRVKIETRRVAWREQTAAIYRKKMMTSELVTD
jgi:hypothetical protein